MVQREPRPGEVAVAMPDAADAELFFIGIIRSPWTEISQCPRNGQEARERGQTVEAIIDPRFSLALDGIEDFSHVWLIYWMHLSQRDLVRQWPRHVAAARGTFALRSPVRPNPIAMAACKVIGRTGNRLRLLGADCLDWTPLIDIKPYLATTDAIPDAFKRET